MYRPVIYRKSAKALLKVLHEGIDKAGLSEPEIVDVIRFMNKISERDQIATIVERLKLDDTTEEEYDDELEILKQDLESRLTSELQDYVDMFDYPDSPKAKLVEYAKQLLRERGES